MAGSQAIRIEPARLPKGLVLLDLTVGGRAQIAAPATADAPAETGFVYQWPGTYFVAAFQGRTLYFRTGEGRQGLHLVVDRQPAIAFISSQPSAYRVVGLTRGPHTVRLMIVTESQAGPTGFKGFSVPRQDRRSPGASLGRQMEFIGDSYTVGYGNTSSRTGCSHEEVWSTTDDSLAFGPLTAAGFGADYQVNAISGRGVVRNYNGGKRDTLPEVYPYLLFNKKQHYRDASWKPQVIVVGLGTNDFSTALNAGEPWTTREELHAAYEASYVAFLQSLRQDHPAALLVVWATGGEGGEIESEAGNVVERLRHEGDRMVEFVPISGLQMSGCDEHPSAVDDQTISVRLREVIEAHPEVWQGSRGSQSGRVSAP